MLQAFSPDGRFIVSADRDSKIRVMLQHHFNKLKLPLINFVSDVIWFLCKVSVVPKDPLKGAHEIQSFCLGHSE